jgi:uncharacterized membrane-anchored protein YhcB (DUF1043 family)
VIASLSSFNFWVQLIVSLGFLVGIIFGGIKATNEFIKWWHQKVADVALSNIQEEIEEIKKQYKPNGGASMRDAINRIEATLNRLDAKLDLVQTELDKHLGAHEGL